MTLSEFCLSLDKLEFSNLEKALSILWFKDNENNGVIVKAGELTKIIKVTGLGNPNSTSLEKKIKDTRLVIISKSGLQLKPTARNKIYSLIEPILVHKKPAVDHEKGFISEDIWSNTKHYIEIIAKQVNGCYEYGFFDGVSVLVRRLIETLIIECYEFLNKENEIKDANGDYKMLNALITISVDNGGLTLGRETKKTLRNIKRNGDNAAHNRRYITTKSDLTNLQDGIRIAVQELIMISSLKRI